MQNENLDHFQSHLLRNTAANDGNGNFRNSRQQFNFRLLPLKYLSKILCNDSSQPVGNNRLRSSINSSQNRFLDLLPMCKNSEKTKNSKSSSFNFFCRKNPLKHNDTERKRHYLIHGRIKRWLHKIQLS